MPRSKGSSNNNSVIENKTSFGYSGFFLGGGTKEILCYYTFPISVQWSSFIEKILQRVWFVIENIFDAFLLVPSCQEYFIFPVKHFRIADVNTDYFFFVFMSGCLRSSQAKCHVLSQLDFLFVFFLLKASHEIFHSYYYNNI